MKATTFDRKLKFGFGGAQDSSELAIRGKKEVKEAKVNLGDLSESLENPGRFLRIMEGLTPLVQKAVWEYLASPGMSPASLDFFERDYFVVFNNPSGSGGKETALYQSLPIVKDRKGKEIGRGVRIRVFSDEAILSNMISEDADEEEAAERIKRSYYSFKGMAEEKIQEAFSGRRIDPYLLVAANYPLVYKARTGGAAAVEVALEEIEESAWSKDLIFDKQLVENVLGRGHTLLHGEEWCRRHH